jgi:hypothetical protein
MPSTSSYRWKPKSRFFKALLDPGFRRGERFDDLLDTFPGSSKTLPNASFYNL